MRKYVKPAIEVISLRVEERIASCSGGALYTEFNWDGPTCNLEALDHGANQASCFDMVDCS